MKIIATLWNTLKKPPVHISLGVIIIVSFVAGIVFWGGFNTAMEYTNTEEFCVSCHEMEDNVYQELQTTVHWSNRTGVRAICSDCHVPHNWTSKIARKMQASKEVWGAIFGTIDTPEKFEAKRLELAQHEWARFKANGSLECRSCHDYNSMDWDKMSDEARRFMEPAAERDQSCIDCHKGIAHKLPEQMGSEDPMLARLVREATSVSLDEGQRYYSAKSVDLFTDPELTQRAGVLQVATGVNIVDTQGDSVKLEIPAWRKEKGFGRVLYEDFGQNIGSAVLNKDIAQDDALIEVQETDVVDEMTGLPWGRVNVALWAEKGVYLENREALWETAGQTYRDACSVCHTEPAPEHFDANTWPAMFSGMVGFTNMSAGTQELVLKYLQMHSSDYAEGAH
ncbi:trimethylamine-N-oxide reductase (cytochrome c), cytochrome c-type subunit TorC [Halomonas shengliensis]|uniref:Cytochrome c-type protein n=1 Tax=Halomonas shengliensis TaxID=419597 RepID=A0A1H0JLF8_9GAMM|nr:pentaheme c-type cytochrome TorC [Halomonas shengliensis]SDO44211.1 trimethylamine-N-oxide reductase (cytochrome c), cytochrome c-type subunit TorC [Halomonas shengliensis]